MKESGTAAAGRGRREAVQQLYNLQLRPRQAAVLSFGLSAILLRTTEHVLAFDLGLFTIRRREIAALRRLDAQFHTHIHFDHWSVWFTRAIHERTGAPAIVELQIAKKGRISVDWLLSARPGVPIAIGDRRITSITGRHGGPITLFHVELPELTVFHGGDSGHVALDHLKADVAFVPVGGPAPSCTPQSGAAIVRDLKPGVVIPMHGFTRQKKAFERYVRTEAPGIRVVIPRRRVPLVVDLGSP